MQAQTELQFNSPSSGKVNFTNVIYELVNFMEENPKTKYRLIIGTDSRSNNGHTKAGNKKQNSETNHKVEFVTAIVIHRLGRGARYFWRKEAKENIHTLRQKIYEEAGLSLVMAQKLLKGLEKYLTSVTDNPISKPPEYELEIHIDIGQGGPTREMIKEIVGMVHGSGFNAKTKPCSFGASTVADRHT